MERRSRGRPKSSITAGRRAAVTKTLPEKVSSTVGSVANSRTTRSSPSRRASPSRLASPAGRGSPKRRSSRPRTALSAAVPAVGDKISSTTAVLGANSSIKKEASAPSNVKPTVSSTTYVKKSPTSITRTYNKSTHETLEIRATSTETGGLTKLGNFLRRSVSKNLLANDENADDDDDDDRATTITRRSQTPGTNTDAGTRYSRSISRSIFDGDENTEFSDEDFDDLGNPRSSAVGRRQRRKVTTTAINENDEGGEEEEEEANTHFKNNTSPKYVSTLFCRNIQAPREFGGWLGTIFLIIFVPILIYYLNWTCQRTACIFKIPNFTALIDPKYIIERVFKLEAIELYLGYILTLTILTIIIYGRRVTLPTEKAALIYRFNATYLAFILTIAFIGAEIAQIPVAEFFIKNYLRILIYNIICTFIAALWFYYRGRGKIADMRDVNPYAKTGNIIIDFAQGRLLNPKLFDHIRYKQIFLRISLLTTYLLALSLLRRNLKMPTTLPSIDKSQNYIDNWNAISLYLQNIEYNGGAIITAGQLFIYVLDAIVYECQLITSFEMNGEGLGFLLLLRYAVAPFLHSSVAKYFNDYAAELKNQCNYAFYIAGILFFAGLLIKRVSSSIKYKYRLYPNSLMFQKLETINTYQGKRLILGEFWGKVRQPNYTGDIVALLGMVIPVFLKFAWPPVIAILLCIILLLHRAVRVNARNLAQYHSSWVRYCNRVRDYVLPKIF